LSSEPFLQDALLHAIKEEYVEGVEILLVWEEQNHKPGQPYVSTDISRGKQSQHGIHA
jgi:transient receptor potential cation channel subfamily C